MAFGFALRAQGELAIDALSRSLHRTFIVLSASAHRVARMNTPALTWQLRRIGTTLWPALPGRKCRSWLDAADKQVRQSPLDARARPSDHWLAAPRGRPT
jgi:hypothetical protein